MYFVLLYMYIYPFVRWIFLNLGNDIHISSDLPGTSQTYQAVNLTLVTATFYFTSVTAFGSSGLLTSAVSDGFLLDTRPPTSGLILDGLGN